MSASFAKSNLSVWNVESHQTLTLLISTTLSDTFHQDLELLFTIGSDVSVHFHCHLVVHPNGPSSLPGAVDLIFIVYTGYLVCWNTSINCIGRIRLPPQLMPLHCLSESPLQPVLQFLNARHLALPVTRDGQSCRK